MSIRMAYSADADVVRRITHETIKTIKVVMS